MKEFLAVAVSRIKSESPAFFIQLRKFCMWVGSALVAILFAKNFISQFGFVFPQSAIQVIGYGICACASITGVTFLTTKNPNATDDGLRDKPTTDPDKNS